MGSKLPLVSVIITNYNYDKYVQRCIESVLKQDYDHLQIIIIDDGSTDKSIEIINQYKGQCANVTVITQQNKGVVYTRNKGLKLVDGDYFIFIDADDTIPSNFVSKMLETAEESKADVVCCDLRTEAVLEVEPMSIVTFLSFGATPICQLIRTKSLPRKVQFDKELNTLGHEDIDFFFNLYMNGLRFVKCFDVMYQYNVHGSGRSPQISGLSQKHYEARKYIYKKHLPSIELNELQSALVEVLLLKDNKIFEWIDVARERLDLIRKFQDDQKVKEKIIKAKDNELEIKQRELDEIKNSRKYKIARTISAPLSKLKSIQRKEKNE